MRVYDRSSALPALARERVHLRSGASLVFWAATALPPLGILAFILKLGVNLPFQDDWDMLAVVTRWHAGTLTFADFWRQHSEHRIAVLKGMIWAAGIATDFNVVANMHIGFALSSVKLVLLFDLIRRHVKGRASGMSAPLALVSSLLMFSLVQYEDWFWGTAALQFSLLNLCTVTVVWVLSRWPDSWRALATAVVCAILGVFTEVSGHVLWVTGALAIWLFTERRERAVHRLLAWLAAAACVLLIYLWDLRWAPSSSATAFFDYPSRLVAFTGACLGLPFAFWMTPGWAAVVGYGSLIPFVVSGLWLHVKDRARLRSMYPFLLFALHGAVVCVLIALGRSKGDPQGALTSHYSFAPNLYWIAVLTVTVVTCAEAWPVFTFRGRLVGLTLAATVALVLATFYVKGNAEGYHRAYTRSRNLQMALATLSFSTTPPPPVLRFLYEPDERRALALVEELRAANLGPFSGAVAAEPAHVEQFDPVPAGEQPEGVLDGGDCYGATGWAWNPADPDRPVTVKIWSGDSLLGTATANWFRWDLLAAVKGNGQHAFHFSFPAQSRLGTGRVVTVTYGDTNTLLWQSPKTIHCRD